MPPLSGEETGTKGLQETAGPETAEASKSFVQRNKITRKNGNRKWKHKQLFLATATSNLIYL
jgi:hypothetical protein